MAGPLRSTFRNHRFPVIGTTAWITCFGMACRLRLKNYPFCNGSNRPAADSWLLVTRQCDVLDRVHLNSAERRLMLL